MGGVVGIDCCYSLQIIVGRRSFEHCSTDATGPQQVMHAPCHAGPQIHVPDYSKAAVAKENSQTSPGNERPFEGLIYYGYLAVGTSECALRNTSLMVLRSARCSIASFGVLPPPFICDLHCSPELSTGPWGAAEKAASNSSYSPSHPLLHNHGRGRTGSNREREREFRSVQCTETECSARRCMKKRCYGAFCMLACLLACSLAPPWRR